MQAYAFLFLFMTPFLYAADFILPTNLSVSDIPVISQNFASGFLARTPMILVGQDKFKTQIGLRVSTIDTTKIAKLGNKSESKEVKIQEISFSKQLPLNIELGMHSSLSVFDRDINTFGGYFRWGFKNYPWGILSFVGHGTSANFKNVIGTNLYGGSLNANLKLWSWDLALGTGLVRSTNSFDASLFGATSQEASKNYAKMYFHQTLKLSYVWNNFSISAQGDWLKEFFSSVNLAYLF